jgi:hypothetical protein
VKSLSLIFYGENGESAKAAAGKIRKDGGSAQLRHAYAFDGEAEQDAAAVILLADVTDYDATRIKAAYGDKVQSLAVGAAVPPPPPPPPPPADPLAKLAPDWRTGDVTKLKSLAAAVSDGRAVDNKDQAIAVIETALEARSAK